jgi:aspartyl aminopeptidase
MSELGKVDKGGGGTIALFAARYGMNTIDVGIPVLAMHAPTEIIDKRDLENTEKLYEKFLTI